MSNSFKISISSIFAVLIFITQFISLSYLSWYNILRYVTIVLLGLYVGKRIKIVFQRKYLFINIIAIVFCILTIYTSYLNRSRMGDRDPFLASIPFSAAFIFSLFFMEIMAEYKNVNKTINIFYKTATVVAVITDILIFIVPSLFTAYRRYFVGTKFSVVYLHLLLIILYLVRNSVKELSNYKKITLILLFIWSVFIGIRVDCSTGIVGDIILLLLIFVIRNRERLFLSGGFYCLVQALGFAFVFFYELVLGNPTVEHIIVNYLGRDITLTSRTRIFERVPIILTEHDGWIQGMGYGSSYDLGTRYGGFPDTQNGILEWIWQVGIPTTIIMVLMFAVMLTISKKYMSEENRGYLYPFIAGLYLFTILGTVEITITPMYFSIAICIMAFAIESNKKKTYIGYEKQYSRISSNERLDQL